MTTPEWLIELERWDTPTICNALELVAPQRRGHGFTLKPFSVLYPAMKPIVGFARTAKIRASHPDTSEGAESIQKLDYYEYMAREPVPKIVVIEDVDPIPGVGAFWGEVNTHVHKGLGAMGVVTNGSYRDIPDSAPDFQVLGGMVGPSHAFVHAVEINTSVSVHGMRVEHNDVIHADQHGAVVIPLDVVDQIPKAVSLLVERESKILRAARSKDFSFEKLKAAISEAAEIH